MTKASSYHLNSTEYQDHMQVFGKAPRLPAKRTRTSHTAGAEKGTAVSQSGVPLSLSAMCVCACVSPGCVITLCISKEQSSKENRSMQLA